MADISVNGLAELVAVANNDEVPIWDLSAGQLMFIQRSNLVGATFTGGGTIVTGGFTFTVPATGTPAMLTLANVFTQKQTIPRIGASSPITLLDDTAIAIAFGGSGILILSTGFLATASGMFAFRSASSPFCGILASAPSTLLVATTETILAGTTGTDGKMTVSAHSNGNIYIENRTGTSFSINYILLG